MDCPQIGRRPSGRSLSSSWCYVDKQNLDGIENTLHLVIIDDERDELEITDEIAKSFGVSKILLEEAKELKLLNNSLLLKNENLEDLNNKLESENLILKKDLDQKTIDVEKTISKYANYSSNLIEQEEKRQSDVLEKKQNEIKDKKMQWRNHENEVQNYIQLICKNNVIDYVGQEDFPHPKNKPDSSVRIMNQLIVFDSKSPMGDDTSKLNNYLREQASNLKKYAKHSDVKKELFLVVPSNTTKSIKDFRIDCGDYVVFIVTVDALEPIILSLKKIEEYEFADKLSPDERDDICRVIGTFAHSAKRRVQIDQWFNERILSDIEKAGKLLPPEYVKQVQQYDIAEKLNPPQEKRNKRIELSELKESNLNFKQEMHNKFKILDKNIPEIETKITEKPN